MMERERSSRVVPARVGVRLAAVAAWCMFAVGCAALGGVRRDDAVSSAVRGVCGARASDSTCTVRAVERVDRGYRVVVDRRPPAGRDRVAVEVRGKPFGGSSILVTPLDSVAPRP